MAKKMNTDCPLQVECGKACNHIGTENECMYYKANSRPGMSMEKWDNLQNESADSFMNEPVDRPDSEMVYLNIADIYPHPDNPRKNLGDLTELADSIKSNGIFQNLTVVQNEDEKYTVIIGHRRLAAAKLAGLEKVPCVIASLSPQEQFRTMMVENMQRSDLTNLEQADGFQMMLDLGDTKEMISEKTGFSKSTINKRLKLREFDRKKIEAAEARGGTLFDYMKLAEVKNEKRRNELLDKVGTSEFLNSLQSELNQQIREEDKKRILEEVKQFATKMKDPSARWGSKYERVVSFRLGENPPCKVKAPKGDGPFEYVDSSWDVEIYQKKKAAEKEKKPADQVAYEKWAKETKSKLTDISDRHKQLRMNFINSQSEGKLLREKKYLNILAMASRAFSGINTLEFNRYYDRDLIEKAFDIKYKANCFYNSTDEERSEAENKMAQTPTLLLLYEIVSGFESTGRNGVSFWTEKYPYGFENNSRTEKTIVEYYKFLEGLGYETSDEEKKAIDGSLLAEIVSTSPPEPKKR